MKNTAKRLGIKEADIIWYHSGSCYNRIQVRTLKAAKTVTKAVKGDTVNGGWYDGMQLGGQTKCADGYEVMC